MLSKGDRLPEVSLPVVRGEQALMAGIGELTAGKKTVWFAVPGAFTPTCSDEHLPGYVKHVGAFRERGIAEIFCLSVNDGFVMAAWKRDAGVAGEIVFLADGNGDFTRAAGMEMDGTGFVLGMRSKRYAMLVDDGIVSRIHVEDGAGLDVSSAESLLASI